MLADDVRECPATWTLAASWVLVFALMHLVQWRSGVEAPAGGFANPLAISSTVGHRFGDMTWAEVRHGEVWRLVTATFVHFSLVHVGMNVFGLIKLGQLVEPWYGSGPFLAVCLAIGGFGNLVGGLIRQAITLGKANLAGSRVARLWPAWFEGGQFDGMDASFLIPSGGGSTVLLGLLGLGAVVGWRSKTRIGSFLRDQMVAILGFTAVLGVVLFQLIDNYGHAGGAIVGALFGFAHRPLLRISERSRPFRLACWTGVVAAVVACLVAAGRDDRFELGFRADVVQVWNRNQADTQTLTDLERVAVLYARNLSLTLTIQNPPSELDLIALERLLKAIPTAPLSSTAGSTPAEGWPARTRTELTTALQALEARPADAWGAVVAGDLAEIKTLTRAALDQAPEYPEVYAFVVAWRAAHARITLDRDQAQTRLVELERQVR